MSDIGRLVTTATSAEATPPEKSEAFDELVRRFQDLAFGCAYSVLHDFYLAEDAAQEAFITAWQKLDQLRQPDAFPGWFRRLVLTACNRLTRCQRLTFVPLEADFTPPADPDPHARAERLEVHNRVRAAIGGLPESERVVTTLFYLGEYAQAEIASFLDLPVTTVVKRLASARRRLKEERMLEMFADDLREHRPSRDGVFAEQVRTRLRPFAGPDWESVAAFTYDLEPDYRADDEVWLRNRRQFDESRYVRRHYVAEHSETGQLLGYGAIEQTIYLPKYRLFLMADPQWLRAGVGDLLLNQLLVDLRAAKAITVWHRNYAQLTGVLDFLTERGFRETIRLYDLRLHLSDADPTLGLPVSEQVAARGIEITTFAEESARDPACLHRLHEFLNAAKADDPQRRPFLPAPFEAAERWCSSSCFVPDAAFIAKHRGRYIGFTDLIRYETIPGGITHGFTGVARNYRRQGVATALKLRAIAYARAHGYRVIRAMVYPSQAGMLALNGRLGFRRAYSYVTLEMCLKQVAELDPQIYDAYVGQYAPDPADLSAHGIPAGLSVTIKRIGDRLFSEARDMQDELFPESETDFFTDHHYGQGTFVRDESGRVTHLLYREGAMTLRAKKID